MMHLNRQLSIVRHVTADIKSKDLSELIDSLPEQSETRRAIRALKEIENVGDVGAMEILLSLFGMAFRDDRKNGPGIEKDLS